MKRNLKKRYDLIIAVSIIMFLVCSGSQASSRNFNPGVAPPQSTPYGQSYGAWSDAWWTWALTIAAESNPMLDDTGENGAVEQSGPVWFLAGTWNITSTPVVRNLTVPAGRALFFPLVNSVWVNIPELGDAPWSDEQEAYARSLAANDMDNAGDLSCDVDGQQLINLETYRCRTPAGGAGMVAFPDGNVWGLPADTYGPMVTEGYYLMLRPLSQGEHTIHFTGSVYGKDPLDVTYHLTVK